MTSDEITLYFETVPGELADLEVVSQAVIEWVNTLRAIANEVAPGEPFEIKLVEAKRSSVRLRTALDWLEAQLERVHTSGSRYPRLKQLAISLAVFSAGASWDVIYDSLSDDEKAIVAELSDADRELLKSVLEASRKPSVDTPKRKFFRKLEQDPTVTGIGVALGVDDRPLSVVPSTEFHARGQRWALLPESLERSVEQVLDVTLLTPQLEARPLSWRFKQEGLPSFYAVMADKEFLAALDSSAIKEQLRVGIGMTIRLSTKEVYEEGGWIVPKGGRRVIEVITPSLDREPSLFASPPEKEN